MAEHNRGRTQGEAGPAPRFDDAGQLVAPRFDDPFFSREDGLAETEHVFLEGNRLPGRFLAMGVGRSFTIGETGFGTGLNFLASWRLFEQAAPCGATLRYVSIEKYPLEAETIRRAVGPWPELGMYIDALLDIYDTPPAGTHRYTFAGGRVELILLVGEAEAVLAASDTRADAWFLDGFAPARNPAMWSDGVFSHVARLSAPGATLATYTAAGFVRRGLEAAGFEVEKRPGFGAKRDMTVGRWRG